MKHPLHKKTYRTPYIAILGILCLCFSTGFSQTLNIEECYEKAKINYPLSKQLKLTEETQKLTLSGLNKNYLPQISAFARASYQSDVTSLPITIPGMTIPGIAKDQYQIGLDISQTVWDGGTTKAQKKSTISNTEIEKQKIEVDLYALKDKINLLYFGILLVKQQLLQNATLQTELQQNLVKITSLQKNGLANQSDINLIKIEQINASQQEIALKSNLKTNLDQLSILINEKLSDNTELTAPTIEYDPKQEAKIIRPEIDLFGTQKTTIENQREVIKSASRPKVALFVQGGYGRPSLNMLNNEFSTYYMGGIKAVWNLYNLYTQENNLKKLNLNKQSIDIQEETFLTNTQANIKRQQNEIERLKLTLTNDNELIALRAAIKEVTNLKIENGTATVSDLLKDTNAHNMAILNKSLHEIQLSLAIYQLKNYTN